MGFFKFLSSSGKSSHRGEKNAQKIPAESSSTKLSQNSAKVSHQIGHGSSKSPPEASAPRPSPSLPIASIAETSSENVLSTSLDSAKLQPSPLTSFTSTLKCDNSNKSDTTVGTFSDGSVKSNGEYVTDGSIKNGSVHGGSMKNGSSLVSRLRFTFGTAMLADPRKGSKGEDAYFTAEDLGAAGVADGVGNWSVIGVDAGEFARRLMHGVHSTLAEQKVKDLRAALHQGANAAAVPGSSTASLIYLDPQNPILHGLTLGDSQFAVIREGVVVYRSPDQAHRFNFPFQLGSPNAPPNMGLPPDLPENTGRRTTPKTPHYAAMIRRSSGRPRDPLDTPDAALSSQVSVQDGDVVVLATDGLWDNLYDQDIVRIINKLTAARKAKLDRQAAKVERKNRRNSGTAATDDNGSVHSVTSLDSGDEGSVRDGSVLASLEPGPSIANAKNSGSGKKKTGLFGMMSSIGSTQGQSSAGGSVKGSTASASGSTKGSSSSKKNESLEKEIAGRLAFFARQRSFDAESMSPFAVKAAQYGEEDYASGGKVDDITVVVGTVVRTVSVGRPPASSPSLTAGSLASQKPLVPALVTRPESLVLLLSP